MGAAGILLAMNQSFFWQFFGVLEAFGIQVIIDTSFFYSMLGIFLSMVFLVYPAQASESRSIPWYAVSYTHLTLPTIYSV